MLRREPLENAPELR